MERECSRCLIEKPECEFSGESVWCKQCRREYKTDWRARNPGKAAATLKSWLERNPEKKRALAKKKAERNKIRFATDPVYAEKIRARDREKYARAQRKIHGPDWVAIPSLKKTPEERRARYRAIRERRIARQPEKMKARKALQKAVELGTITRQPCFVCGAEPAHGHHPDYDAPLAVTWLCEAHHREVHESSAS